MYTNKYQHKKTQKSATFPKKKKIRVGTWPDHPLPSFCRIFGFFLTWQNPLMDCIDQHQLYMHWNVYYPSPWLCDQTLLMTVADGQTIASAAVTFWINVFPDIAKSVFLSEPSGATNEQWVWSMVIRGLLIYQNLSRNYNVYKQFIVCLYNNFIYLCMVSSHRFCQIRKCFQALVIEFGFERFVEMLFMLNSLCFLSTLLGDF